MTDSRLYCRIERATRQARSRLRGLPSDDRGTISILTVVAIFGFTMLMGMVINVGRHVDDKIRLQNAADAATYSGGAVLARGMNGIAFTNHLLCDVFALTAIMREARDRHVDPLTPEILQAWTRVGPMFQKAQKFPKFQALGQAIPQKVPLEQQLVQAYGDMAHAASQQVLPVLESILQQQLIPKFQRVYVRTLPQVANGAAAEIARRHEQDMQARTGRTTAILWRTRVLPVGYPDENDPNQRTLPAVDADPAQSDVNQVSYGRSQYVQTAVSQRRRLSRDYLRQWNGWNDRYNNYDDFLQFFDMEGKMSQFSNLWRVFSCGQLTKLLDQEYPQTNLLHVIRLQEPQLNSNQYLDQNFHFVGVSYRRPLNETSPLFFRNPLAQALGSGQSTSLTFAQVQLFIPRGRRVYPFEVPETVIRNGVPEVVWVPLFDNWPGDWNLINQNWTSQIVPATHDNIAQILQSPLAQQFVQNYQPVNFGSLAPGDVRRVNTH